MDLDGAVNDLRSFVAENREGLGTTFDHLNAITTALNDSRGDIKQALHIAPSVFSNFTNIYQPAQSAITGILAPVNFADTVQFICSSIQAASREGCEQSSKLCDAVSGADHQEPPVQLPAAGRQPIRRRVGAAQRDHLQRGPAQPAPAAGRARPAADPTPPVAAGRRGAAPPAPRRSRPPGLAGMMVPQAALAARRLSRAASCLAIACLAVVPGCEWRGLNSLTAAGNRRATATVPTPFRRNCPTSSTIQQNTRVRVADVNVGNVTKIEVQDWHALVTMRINGDVHLPANSTAKVGQTSLLGSMHIELAPPDRRGAARSSSRTVR